ncbi:hypothetical protein [Pseudomonas xionganensis]|uniref:Uncharacterized protein n=1 Tax=Pseudomonas xionganensis TaxID=2654845 RepID=A0A6I4KXP0_9PSED|nr:hypothetical protein [Pseudomonas xionganensis]MVW75552.1 hypothetical protein [Pseudomonas xionganensis]
MAGLLKFAGVLTLAKVICAIEKISRWSSGILPNQEVFIRNFLGGIFAWLIYDHMLSRAAEADLHRGSLL